MIKRIITPINDQRGYILPLSLAIMMFGTLVVGSLLTFVNTSLNIMTQSRDDVNAHQAADAGINVVLAKLIQADYKENENGEPDELGNPAPLPNRAYPTDDESLRIDVDDILEEQINEYEVRVIVEHSRMKVPDYFEYEITSYACIPGSLEIDNAKAKAVVVVRQIPYPAYEAWNYELNILYYEQQ